MPVLGEEDGDKSYEKNGNQVNETKIPGFLFISRLGIASVFLGESRI
jgi:hypothetical protein